MKGEKKGKNYFIVDFKIAKEILMNLQGKYRKRMQKKRKSEEKNEENHFCVILALF